MGLEQVSLINLNTEIQYGTRTSIESVLGSPPGNFWIKQEHFAVQNYRLVGSNLRSRVVLPKEIFVF